MHQYHEESKTRTAASSYSSHRFDERQIVPQLMPCSDGCPIVLIARPHLCWRVDGPLGGDSGWSGKSLTRKANVARISIFLAQRRCSFFPTAVVHSYLCSLPALCAFTCCVKFFLAVSNCIAYNACFLYPYLHVRAIFHVKPLTL
jgi:hypothetical protein